MPTDRKNLRPIQAGSWVYQSGDSYIVTGIDRSGRRFRMATESWLHASGVNVWQGSRWLVRDGKRYLIHRIHH